MNWIIDADIRGAFDHAIETWWCERCDITRMSLGVFNVTEAGARTVEFALKENTRDADGYYRVATLNVAPSP